MMMRVGLVGCAKLKLQRTAPAEELYISPLFRAARQYVESSCDRWFVLSAEHGLVHPRKRLAPYDKSLKDVSAEERKAWASVVLRSLDRRFRDYRHLVFEVHAGASYLNFGLLDGLLDRGAKVRNPLKGLGLGERLQKYRSSRF